MKFKNIKAALFIGFSLIIIMMSVYFYQVFFNPNLLITQEKAVLYIPENADINQVIDSLKKHKYLEDVVSFGFVSKVLDYQENIKPGRYILTKKMTNLQAIRHLRSGVQEPVRVTFNNIRLKEDLAKKICKNVIATEDQFMELLNNPEYVSKFGFDTTTIISMFIPNTYEMYWTSTAEDIFSRMKNEYDKFWDDERTAKASELGLTPLQVSILASIVQAETVKNDEKPVVAGLYLNRLERNMLLESDPTVVFALRDFGMKRVLKRHLETDSPYNTYKNLGLPPGPINLPEPSTLEAVLNYEHHNYIYMCAKEDFSGYHRFASNYRQHINNARKYQQALNRRGVYK
ncbi:endolytic transglycosylase MltG [Chondrinema litorale]|uniref:endolytic transglycosylase MltG n=1 Tax=Chondrinema litorale TaxID=2994555 RepID=UPI002544B1BD|nr:endolytic transglycosylase MltG [Chondrinema litorale]UZR93491.1 endolytic transglycosylase MltG [Chondrinema litorale]